LLFHPAYLDVAERAGRIQKALRDGSLSERDTAFLAEAYAYRYKEGVLGLGHTGAAEPASEGEFEDPYTLSFVITRLQEDRDGDVVLPLGCRLGNFEKSPVWFFGHQEWAVPIGTARNKRHDRLYVWPQEDLIRAACRFDEEDPDAMFIHGKVKRGFLNATSMSFVPIEAYKRDTVHEKAVPHEGRSQRPLGWLFKAYDLTEISIVGVGSNAGAIRDALDQEKSFISPRLQKGMMAYAAQAKGCWNGWCPCPPCEKVRAGEEPEGQLESRRQVRVVREAVPGDTSGQTGPQLWTPRRSIPIRCPGRIRCSAASRSTNGTWRCPARSRRIPLLKRLPRLSPTCRPSAPSLLACLPSCGTACLCGRTRGRRGK
jgi:hypothetical protein